MSTEPDPQAVHEFVREYARRHLANIDHGDVLDEMLGDERFAHLMTGDEDQDIATLDPIAAEIKDVAKAAMLSWPDERAQDVGGPCAVCYCRGCTQCVNPSPPHEVCFCRKAFRAMAGKVAGGQPQDAQPERDGDGDVRAVAEAVDRLKRWLVGRQANVNPEISTTLVRAEPYDRSSASYTIVESDARAVVAALDARDAKAGA